MWDARAGRSGRSANFAYAAFALAMLYVLSLGFFVSITLSAPGGIFDAVSEGLLWVHSLSGVALPGLLLLYAGDTVLHGGVPRAGGSRTVRWLSGLLLVAEILLSLGMVLVYGYLGNLVITHGDARGAGSIIAGSALLLTSIGLVLAVLTVVETVLSELVGPPAGE